MKKLLILIPLMILAAGCQTRTEYGQCVGLGEKQNPKLEYKLSARNIILGVIFIETILPPVFVATDETYCPVGKVEEITSK